MGVGVMLCQQIGAHTFVPCHDQGIHTQKLTQQTAGLQGRDESRMLVWAMKLSSLIMFRRNRSR